jgi:hypothetical protein
MDLTKYGFRIVARAPAGEKVLAGRTVFNLFITRLKELGYEARVQNASEQDDEFNGTAMIDAFVFNGATIPYFIDVSQSGNRLDFSFATWSKTMWPFRIVNHAVSQSGEVDASRAFKDLAKVVRFEAKSALAKVKDEEGAVSDHMLDFDSAKPFINKLLKF